MHFEIKAANQEERLEKWKDHFKNLLRNLPEITDNLTEEIKCQVGIKQFTEEELGTVLKTIKRRNSAGLSEIAPNSIEDKRIWRHISSNMQSYL